MKVMDRTPRRIFKYVTPARIDIIEQLRIRFTPPSCFNDPFEARFCFDDAVIDNYSEIADRRHYRNHVLFQNSKGGHPMTFEGYRRHQAEFREKLKLNPDSKRESVAAKAQKFWDT